MRTIEIKLYKFSELSERAKQKAINNHLNNIDGSHIYDEIKQSVDKLCDLFNLKTGNQYDDLRHSHIDDDILNLSGVRLYKYLVNNYWNELFKPKYLKCIDREIKAKQFICKVNTNHKGNKYTMLYSKYLKSSSCVLTGMCFDDDILKPVYDFINLPDKNTTFEDLINSIENAISKVFRDTEEWISSSEYLIEEIEANEYDFTEDGNIF